MGLNGPLEWSPGDALQPSVSGGALPPKGATLAQLLSVAEADPV